MGHFPIDRPTTKSTFPRFTFCVTDSSRPQNRLNFVHNHIEPPVKAFTSQIQFFFFFLNSILSHFSLSLSFLSFQHNYDDFSTTLPDQIKTGRAPLSAFFFFFFLTQLFTSPRRTKRNPSDLSVLARQIFRSHLKRLSLKRSQCEFGLLCRVQHPGRHSSRLQMIWRLTSGFSRRFAATLTLVG